MKHKVIQWKQSKECVFKVRGNICQKSTSWCNKMMMIIIITNRKEKKRKTDILNESLIETFSIFQITDGQPN